VTLDAIAQEYWDLLMRANPTWATLLGDHRFDTELEEVSEEAHAVQIADLKNLLRRAKALDTTAMDPRDRQTLAVLTFEATKNVEMLESTLDEFVVSPAFGPQILMLQFAVMVTLPEPEHADALVERYSKMGRFFDQAAERLRMGVSHGRTPPRIAVERTVAQIGEMLATPLDSDPFLAPPPPPAWDDAQTAAWRERLRTIIRDVIRPGIERYGECLRQDVLEHAREPEKSGLVWLPDGEEIYPKAIRWYTTLEQDPDAVHTIGLESNAALAEEYRTLGASVLGVSDLATVFTTLRDDPTLRFSSPEQVQEHAERAVAKARDGVKEWFGVLPTVDCEVRPVSEHEGPTAPMGYYMPPATDGSRPGVYFVNTYDPATKTTYEAEALAFHEALPGHHLQIALAQDMEDLPQFRRQSLVTAYVEGWGLYTERLSDEMGLYESDLSRMGMLSFDSLRNGRLVVDTGIHAQGWSRQQAIDYIRDNSPCPMQDIENEVDRYIGWPGQALAYKTGQREIFRLRAEAKATMGERFDIKGFHDAVLTPGPVPLETLGEIVRAWSAS